MGKVIGNALKTNTSLTDFGCASDLNNDETMTYSSGLEHFFFPENELGNAGASEICESLTINTTLRTLNLDGDDGLNKNSELTNRQMNKRNRKRNWNLWC